MKLQGAALTSHLRSEAKKNARHIDLAKKRNALEKMQSVYREHKSISRLERIGERMQACVRIAKSSLTIALYGAPVVVLTACAVKVVFWILL